MVLGLYLKIKIKSNRENKTKTIKIEEQYGDNA